MELHTLIDNGNVVSTENGAVLGEDRGGVKVFRGIPYGDSVSGERRFHAARPAKPWNGVMDCRQNGPIAVQKGGSISGAGPLGDYFSGGQQEKFGALDEVQAEDCLVLNVLTKDLHEKKPVMVYLHGGGLATGSGTLTIGSDNFVREQDVVLVGVNHRLNVFGFLYLGDMDASYSDSGLCGINDLVLALEWVRDNIEKFGGDPNNVTIFGESGGGMKVSTLLFMKNARGLFHKAIVESGSFPVGIISREEAAKTTATIMNALGLKDGDIEGLLSASAKNLLAAAGKAGMAGLMSLGVVADGKNIDFNPDGWFAASELSMDIPLMVGSSDDELAIFYQSDPAEEITWDNLDKVLVSKMKHPMLASFLHKRARIDEDSAREIVRAFMACNRHNDDPEHTLQRIISRASGLGGGAFYHAMAQSAIGGAPVYCYNVCYDSAHPMLKGKRYAWHTADLPLQMRIVLNPESESFSRTVSAQIAAFARTGNPSIENLEWKPFTPDKRSIMIMDDAFRMEIDPMSKMRNAVAAK